VLRPGQAIDSWSRLLLESIEAVPEQIDRDMVKQGGEPRPLVLACRFAHTLQPGRPVNPALRPARGLQQHVSLSRLPSLRHLRGRWLSALVRWLLRYYATARLPNAVHAGRAAGGLLRPARRTIGEGQRWDLPVPVQGVSTHAQGLRLRGVRDRLAGGADPGVAFRFRQRRRHPGLDGFAAPWLACVCPCQRFAAGLAAVNA